MRGLGAFGGEGLVVVLLGDVGIEAEVEQVAPAELEAGAAGGVVAVRPAYEPMQALARRTMSAVEGMTLAPGTVPVMR